jgi:hypothetical protein
MTKIQFTGLITGFGPIGIIVTAAVPYNQYVHNFNKRVEQSNTVQHIFFGSVDRDAGFVSPSFVGDFLSRFHNLFPGSSTDLMV